MVFDRSASVGTVLFWLAVAPVNLGGCSEQAPKRTPTEQEIHSADRPAGTGVQGRHEFGCNDGGSLLVDFKDQGNTIELREANAASALILTAPTQGLQYVGDDASATFAGGELRLQRSGRPERACRRRSR